MTTFFVFVIFTMAIAIGIDVFQLMRDGKTWDWYKTIGVSIFGAVVLLGIIAALF